MNHSITISPTLKYCVFGFLLNVFVPTVSDEFSASHAKDASLNLILIYSFSHINISSASSGTLTPQGNIRATTAHREALVG